MSLYVDINVVITTPGYVIDYPLEDEPFAPKSLADSLTGQICGGRFEPAAQVREGSCLLRRRASARYLRNSGRRRS
jgi:hypothetical protein